jgi:hypothetical protein
MVCVGSDSFIDDIRVILTCLSPWMKVYLSMKFQKWQMAGQASSLTCGAIRLIFSFCTMKKQTGRVFQSLPWLAGVGVDSEEKEAESYTV